eukprot:6449182-Amphidinium_carterae.1
MLTQGCQVSSQAYDNSIYFLAALRIYKDSNNSQLPSCVIAFGDTFMALHLPRQEGSAIFR